MIKKRTIIRSIVFVVIVAAVVVVVQFVLTAQRLMRYAQAEYPTISAILATEKFVKEHHGAWPTSWNDLNFPEDQRRQVVFQFDLTAAQILANPDLLQSAIVPVTGRYRLYPYSKEDLKHLMDRLEEFRPPANGTVTTEPSEKGKTLNQVSPSP